MKDIGDTAELSPQLFLSEIYFAGIVLPMQVFHGPARGQRKLRGSAKGDAAEKAQGHLLPVSHVLARAVCSELCINWWPTLVKRQC